MVIEMVKLGMLAVFFLLWLGVGGWLIYKWVDTANQENGGYSKQEHIQSLLLITFWMMFGTNLFVMQNYFSTEQMGVVLVALLTSVGIKVYQEIKTKEDGKS